jgi:hypothetical protein
MHPTSTLILWAIGMLKAEKSTISPFAFETHFNAFLNKKLI